MRNTIKTLALGLAAVVAVSMTACMGESSSPVASSKDEFGTIVVQARTNGVNKLSKPGLGKSAAITLETLKVTLTSNVGPADDTTIVIAAGENGFGSAANVEHTVNLVLNLKALRTWYVSVETFDVNDSVIHVAADTIHDLLAGQVRALTLNANPLYTMYKANFNFPDSIYSATGTFGQKIQINKIELEVDGTVVATDARAFVPGETYELTYDYVTNSATNITISVFGKLPQSDSIWSAADTLLYTATRAFSSLSRDSLNPVSLAWQGPVDGVGDLQVVIGKVGLFDVEAVTDSTVLAKK